MWNICETHGFHTFIPWKCSKTTRFMWVSNVFQHVIAHVKFICFFCNIKCFSENYLEEFALFKEYSWTDIVPKNCTSSQNGQSICIFEIKIINWKENKKNKDKRNVDHLQDHKYTFILMNFHVHLSSRHIWDQCYVTLTV